MSLTNKHRILLRNKIQTPVSDPDQLASREMIFGDIEKSIFIKDRTEDVLYQYAPILDSTTDTNSTWSSTQISNYLSTNYAEISHFHEYYDLLNIPRRSILVSASGIGNPTTNSCGTPYIEENSNNPIWSVDFEENNVGFYNFLVPYDYTGVIQGLTLTISNITGVTNWEISTYSYINESSLSSSSLLDTIDFTTSSVDSVSKINISYMDSSSPLLGDGSNKNKLIILKIKSENVSSAKFHNLRIDY